jgi:hypothetical protein
MKNRIKLVFSLALFSMISIGTFAQSGSNFSYEYNDDIYIDDDYREDGRNGTVNYGDRNYDDGRRSNGQRDRAYTNNRRDNRNYNNHGRRNHKASYRSQRARKAMILDRAYFRAYADGWLSRRERRDLRQLESRLGIYRLDRRGRRICR